MLDAFSYTGIATVASGRRDDGLDHVAPALMCGGSDDEAHQGPPAEDLHRDRRRRAAGRGRLPASSGVFSSSGRALDRRGARRVGRRLRSAHGSARDRAARARRWSGGHRAAQAAGTCSRRRSHAAGTGVSAGGEPRGIAEGPGGSRQELRRQGRRSSRRSSRRRPRRPRRRSCQTPAGGGSAPPEVRRHGAGTSSSSRRSRESARASQKAAARAVVAAKNAGLKDVVANNVGTGLVGICPALHDLHRPVPVRVERADRARRARSATAIRSAHACKLPELVGEGVLT